MSKKKKKFIIVAGLVVIVVAAGVIGGVLYFSNQEEEEEFVYRETTVEYGNLSVGITEDSSIDIGIIEQSFQLDISALVLDNTSSLGNTQERFGAIQQPMGMGAGGGDAFSQIFSMVGGENYASSNEQSLEIEEVKVQVGQLIQEGDVLYTLNEESVNEIKSQLETDVEDAKADLDSIQMDQMTDRLLAKHTYESAISYGNYANTEYALKLLELQEAIDTVNDSVADKEKELVDVQQEYVSICEEYTKAVSNYNYVKAGLEEQDIDTYLYGFLTQKSFYDDAKSTMEMLEAKKEAAEEKNEQLTKEVEELKVKLEQSLLDYQTGVLEAEENLAVRRLAAENAEETYDIALAYLDEDIVDIQSTYEDALEKLDIFNSYIIDGAVLSEYSGVVTEVGQTVDDTISTGTSLVSLYNEEEVTMSVNLEEEDREEITVGNTVNISLTAYPDTVFGGIVSEIEDAETDSEGNVTYPVTVTVQGDVSNLYQGMTGELTFITKETKDVLYVSNRALIREGTRSYVKMKDGEGNIIKKRVTTGFSDGTNVEIIEGLSEGDIVLIESKVTES